MNTALQRCFVVRVLEMQACPYVTVGLERVLGSDPGICTSIPDPAGLGKRSAVVSCKYWLIWNSPHNKNAGKFCGHRKHGIVVDTYSKPLCLWIASDASVFWWSGLEWPEPDSIRTWIFFKYPIPDQYLIFHTRSTPIPQYEHTVISGSLQMAHHSLSHRFGSGSVVQRTSKNDCH